MGSFGAQALILGERLIPAHREFPRLARSALATLVGADRLRKSIGDGVVGLKEKLSLKPTYDSRKETWTFPVEELMNRSDKRPKRLLMLFTDGCYADVNEAERRLWDRKHGKPRKRRHGR